MNSCSDSELGVENFIKTFHSHGNGKSSRSDVGYQELNGDEIKYWAMLIWRVKKTQRMMKVLHFNNWYPIKDAFKALETCMRCMEQQEDTNPQQVVLLQKLKK